MSSIDNVARKDRKLERDKARSWSLQGLRLRVNDLIKTVVAFQPGRIPEVAVGLPSAQPIRDVIDTVEGKRDRGDNSAFVELGQYPIRGPELLLHRREPVVTRVQDQRRTIDAA